MYQSNRVGKGRPTIWLLECRYVCVRASCAITVECTLCSVVDLIMFIKTWINGLLKLEFRLVISQALCPYFVWSFNFICFYGNPFLQVNLFQKHIFLYQLTHKRLFIELQVQYLKTTSSEHVVYINCSEC